MSNLEDVDPKLVLAEWLRSEQRLGIAHAAVGASRVAMSAKRQPGAKPNPGTGPQATPTRGASRPDSTVTRGPSVAPTRSVPTAAPVPPGTDPPARVDAAPKRPLQAVPVTGKLLADDRNLPPLCPRELSPAEAAAELARLNEAFVRPCQKCELHKGRTQTVFGVGRPRPELVFVGEGPGADEDRQGEPFVGRAGQLLTRMIAAMTLTREQVYICNVVKCRPPDNRTPTDDEMEVCAPLLWRQLAILRPRVIVALGKPATQTLLAVNIPIGRLRGEFHEFPPPPLAHLGLPRCKVMPTFHPAYLLRSPGEKGKAWEDLKQVMRELGLRVPA